MERTLVILKPDAVQRQILGQIITRFERKGLQIIAAKLMGIDADLAQRHYAEHKGKPFFNSLIEYITSGPVLVMVLRGEEVISITRKMMGATFAHQAEPGTIRGDFGAATGTLNLVHGSDSAESAQREIELFFSDNEIMEYELNNKSWIFNPQSSKE